MKDAVVLALAVLFVICAAEDSHKLDESLDEQWEDFKILYNKQYDGNETERRIIWEHNLAFIREHNIKADWQMYNYHLGMNQFGDMTRDEINSLMLYKHQRHLHDKFSDHEHHITDTHLCVFYWRKGSVARNVDWRKTGHVTVVKDQGYANASWAFAAVGAMEGVWFRKKHQLIDMSEQQLIDCSHPYLKHHYIFSSILGALKQVRDHGIQAEETYPYTGIRRKCLFDKALAVGRAGHCLTISSGREDILQALVALNGPTSVAIDASQSTFHFYKHGLYDDRNCASTHHNHAALIVGYGEIHWLVKNSWGPWWGQDGYIEIARDNENQCGIASSVIYPRM